MGRRRDGQALAALVVASRWVPIYRQRIGPDSMVLDEDSSHMNPEHMNPEHPVRIRLRRHADTSPPMHHHRCITRSRPANIATTCGSTAATCVNICRPRPWRAPPLRLRSRAALRARVSGFGPDRASGPPDIGRRGGGRGRRSRRGDVRTAILALLVDRPMHGYEMIQEINERSNGV